MKFKANRKAFIAAISAVQSAVNERSVNPVNSNTLLSFDGKQLSLIGSNAELTLVARCAVISSDDSDGFTATTFPQQRALDTMAAMNSVEVQVSLTDSNMVIESVGSARAVKTSMRCIPPSEYNSMQKPDNQIGKLPVAFVLSAAGRGMATASSIQNSPMSGVLIRSLDGHKVEFMSTDSYRYSYGTVVAETKPFTVNLPKVALSALKKISGDVTMFTTDDQSRVWFSNGELSVGTTCLASEQYPDMSRFVYQDANIKTTLSVSAADLSAMVKAALAVAPNDSMRVVLDAMPGNPTTLAIRSASAAGGNTSCIETAVVAGEPMKVVLNGPFVLNAIDGFGDATAVFRTSGAANMVEVAMSGIPSAITGIMPMELKQGD